MASDIVYPATLPPPLVEGNAYAAVALAGSTPYEAGQPRRRRRYTRVPRTVSVLWRYTQSEFDTWFDWHEDVLQAGSLPFDVQLAGEGIEDPVWWTANIISHSWQALPGNRYRISASLLLLDGPTAGQRVATSLYASVGLSMRLRGALTGNRATMHGGLSMGAQMRGILTVPSFATATGLRSAIAIGASLRGTLTTAAPEARSIQFATLDFAYGDATPAPLMVARAGYRVDAIEVDIDEAFDGAGAALTVGPAADPGQLIEAGLIDPATPASYELSPQVIYADDTPLFLFITPGAGASAGRGVVFIQTR